MTREKEIRKAAHQHKIDIINGDEYYNCEDSFEAGAEWADSHPAKLESKCITQEEIKKVAQEYADGLAHWFPEVKEKHVYRDKMAQAENVIRVLLRNYNVTSKEGRRQTATIEAWMVRDKHLDVDSGSDLYLGKNYPERQHGTWCGMEEYYPLPQDAFPSVTWENSPKKVKVTIELEEEE